MNLGRDIGLDRVADSSPRNFQMKTCSDCNSSRLQGSLVPAVRYTCLIESDYTSEFFK